MRHALWDGYTQHYMWLCPVPILSPSLSPHLLPPLFPTLSLHLIPLLCATPTTPPTGPQEVATEKMLHILPILRVPSHTYMIEGWHTAPSDGFYVIAWDNTFSRYVTGWPEASFTGNMYA